jgi:hypothetical protein
MATKSNVVVMEPNRPDQPEFSVLRTEEKHVRNLCGTAFYAVHNPGGLSYFIFSGWDEMENVAARVLGNGIRIFTMNERKYKRS